MPRLQSTSDASCRRGQRDGWGRAPERATRDDLVLASQWPAPAPTRTDKQLPLRLEALNRVRQRRGAWLKSDADERVEKGATAARMRIENDLRARTDEGSYARG